MMKMIYLISKQYSENYIREVIIIAQIVGLIILTCIALNPFIYSRMNSTAIENLIDKNTMYFSPYYRILSIINGNFGMDFNEEERNELANKVDKVINELPQVKGMGRIGRVIYSLDNYNYMSGVVYSEDMFQYIDMPLKVGDWNDMLVKGEHIPIIVGSGVGKQYKLGDLIPCVLVNQDTNDTYDVTAIVTGILMDAEIIFTLRQGGTGTAPLNEIVVNQYQSDTIIFPGERIEFFDLKRYNTSCLIFFDKQVDIDKIVKDYRINFSEQGTLQTISQMSIEQLYHDITGHTDDAIMAFSLFILIIFGVGGYIYLIIRVKYKELGIYYVCGMSKMKLLLINSISLGSIILLPMILTVTLAPRYGIIKIDTYTDRISLIISCALVVFVYIISICISFFNIKKLNPIELLKEQSYE